MTRENKMKNHQLASHVDAKKGRDAAHAKCRAAFEKGLSEVRGYVPEGMTPIAVAQQTLQDRIEELDRGWFCYSGIPGSWNRVLYFLSFDMEYQYTGVEEYDDPEMPNGVGKIIYGASDFLEEFGEQQRLRQLFVKYLTAVAAFAKRIGASTYLDWVRLLAEVYDNRKNTLDADDLRKRMHELGRITWAENEVYTHNCKIASDAPRICKKRGKKG